MGYIPIFDSYINSYINSFLIKKINWKEIFTNQVIPKLNKGWKWVANDDYGICLNCYAYGNGIDICCAQTMNRLYNNHDLNTLISFEEYKKLCKYRILEDNFIDFEKKRIVEQNRLRALFSYAIIKRVVPLIE